MAVDAIHAKSLLLTRKRSDSWFVARYHMNIYRGCVHDCAYCDGRAESYRVSGEFGRDVKVKVNAPELLARELDPAGRRKPKTPDSYVLVGGGVGDSYEAIERKQGLTRRVLEVLAARAFPAHVLTKSSLVERDFDLLEKIHARRGAIVSMSFSTADDALAAVFERGASPPSARLATLKRAKALGFGAGIYLMPVLPGISDDVASLAAMLSGARDAGVDFMLFGGLTLKPGRQLEHFLGVLREHDPALVSQYRRIYGRAGRYGNPVGDGEAYRLVHRRFAVLSKRAGIARRIPTRLFRQILPDNERVAVVLENLDYLCRLEGRPERFNRVAQAVASFSEPLGNLRADLASHPAIGRSMSGLIAEILDTGSSRLHDLLL
jgi:DNA repair photolyase